MNPGWYQQPTTFKPHGAGGQGSPISPTPSGIFNVGVNIVGAQNPSPQFPTAAQINYLAAKNINRFRFAIGWSQQGSVTPYVGLVGIQLTAFGPIDTTSTIYNGPAGNGTSYIAQMNAVISAAIAANSKVLIDIHMFGNGPGGLVGSVACPTSAFADLWGKIANYYVSVRPDLLPGIYGFDLMNEWVNGFDSSVVFTASQQAITAIRLAGYLGPLYIEGTNYTSAWNWVSGEGNPYNNNNLYQLFDPVTNLISSSHMYPDPSDSGSLGAQTFSYSVALTVPGAAPVGLDLNPTIGNTRTTREWLPWLAIHGLPGHMGEYGTSTDNPWISGTFDFASWNTITRNLLTLLQGNNIEISVWASGNGGAGYGPNGYGYSLDPFNSNLSGALDFTSTGIQAPVWAVIDDFTGYSGSQPQAYAIFPPGVPNTNLYCTPGTPSSPFTIYYGGKITSPVTITPHDYLADGTTPAGGTFTPATITLGVGDNALATFTYTASVANTLQITVTNNAGWHNPPAIGYSSTTDNFQTAVNQSSIIALRRVVSTYIGPAITLISPADNVTQQTFYFNNRGDLPRQAIQSFAGTRTGIKVAALYSQNGISAGNIVPLAVNQFYTPSLANPFTLNLVNSAGYPEINVVSGQWAGCESFSNGHGLLTVIGRLNGAGTLMSQDIFQGQFRLSPSSGFFVGANGTPGGFVSTGTVSGYTDIGGTYSNLYATNNQKGYNNGTGVSSASPGQFTFAPQYPQSGDTYINAFRFGGQDYQGVWQESIITYDELSPTVMSNIHADNATYYSTPLPDPLPAVPPLIAGAIANQPIFPGTITTRPFSNVVITDANSGSPTDSVTITLSGSSGTLAGSGISGGGPYTIAAATPASVTATLQAAVFTTANTLGNTTNFTIAVVSSAGSNSSNSTTSTVVTAYTAQPILTPPGGTFVGTNHSGYALSGAELLSGGFNSLWPQTFQIDYLASKGFGLFRFTMSSQWLYTSAFGLLNPSYLAGMKQVIDYCFTKNIRVLIDPHNSGNIWNANAGSFQLPIPGTTASDLFQDFWRRLSNAFRNYPNVIFGLNNEPAGISAVNWRDGAVNPSFTAIRANGCTQLVTIAGVGQSSALGWASNGNTAAFAGWAGDPGNNFTFEAHQYLDSTAAGISPVYTLNGSTILNTFISFLTTNGFTGFIGEFGISWDPWYPISPSNQLFDSTMATPETTNNIVQNTNMLNAMISSGVIIGWSEFSAGNEFASPPTQNGYYFQPEPQRASSSAYVIPIVDQPGMATLVAKII